MVARMGPIPWQALYSLLAITGFVLIVWGYGLARQEAGLLYQPAPWLRHLSALLMLPVFPLLFAAYLPGRIQSVSKHPMLAATKFWALAHLLANGGAADVLLFGAFLVWAVADRISVKRRAPTPTRSLPSGKLNDVLALVFGLAVYGAFVLWLHAALFGVPLSPA